MQSLAQRCCSRRLAASASRLVNDRRALVRPRISSTSHAACLFTSTRTIEENPSFKCLIQHRTFSSSADQANEEETTISSINAAPSMENELVKAELAGLTGDDAEYDRLVSELSEALDNLERTAQNGWEGEDDAQVMIDALHSAARCYWNLGFLDESRDLYEDSLSRLIDLHSDDGTGSTNGQQPPDHPQIATTLHWLGSIHARSGNPTEAERWYKSALDMKKRVYGNRTYHPEIGRSLNGLALIQVHQASFSSEDDGGAIGGDEEAWKQAMELFQEAERNYTFANMDRGGGGRTGIAKPVTSVDDEDDEDYSNHPDLAMICENMAMLFRQNNEHQAALTRYQQALSIRQSNAGISGEAGASGVEDGKILGLMLSVADCLRASSKFDEAAELYEQVLASHLQANANDGGPKEEGETRSAIEAVCRHALGMIHAECGRHELALEQYGISMEIKVALAGHDHPEVAVTLNAAGAVHGASGDREKALAHFRQALQIFQLHSGALGDDDPDVINTQRNIRVIEKSALKSGKEDKLTMR